MILKLTIIDFGMGNLRSIQHKLNRIGFHASISSGVDEIASANAIILPGVGHFARGMENLRGLGLVELLTHKVLVERTPILGICLGMQLFSKWSEEGEVEGLGWLNAVTRRFKFDQDKASLRVPHVGWNTLSVKKLSPLVKGIEPVQRFYFVHSYHLCAHDPSDIATTTHYGCEFVSSVHCQNIFGTQFHPEKSHLEGMKILRNFIECTS